MCLSVSINSSVSILGSRLELLKECHVIYYLLSRKCFFHYIYGFNLPVLFEEYYSACDNSFIMTEKVNLMMSSWLSYCGGLGCYNFFKPALPTGTVEFERRMLLSVIMGSE